MSNIDDLTDDFQNICQYIPQAIKFLDKFLSGEKCKSNSVLDGDVKIISMLWVEADKYDTLVLGMFEFLNNLFGKGVSDVNTSRGGLEHNDEPDPFYYFYCRWEFMHSNKPIITVTLGTENFRFEPIIHIQNSSGQTNQSFSLMSEQINEKLKRSITQCAITEFDLDILSNPLNCSS